MQRQASSGSAVAEAPVEGYVEGASAGHGALLRAEALRKTFRSGGQEITPLDGVNFAVQPGEIVAIVGPSGCGKSTLLHLLGALDTPTSGAVYFAGCSLALFDEAEVAEYRRSTVGFVWQRHHLLPDFSAAENVAMPLLVCGTPPRQALRTAEELLGEAGLAGRARQTAGQLSGGEQQRVAIARALANGPKLLLADEPTGDLDEQNAEHIFELMQRLHRSHRLTSIFATHNLALARRADRVVQIARGVLAPWAPAGRETPGAGCGESESAVNRV